MRCTFILVLHPTASYLHLAATTKATDNRQVRLSGHHGPLLHPCLQCVAAVQGNCVEDPPDALKQFVTADMPDRQCFVVALAPADSWIFKIETQTWLDNLKIVEGRVPLADGEEAPPAIVVEKAGQMWATQVTLEGAQAVNGTALNQRGLMVHGDAYMGGMLPRCACMHTVCMFAACSSCTSEFRAMLYHKLHVPSLRLFHTSMTISRHCTTSHKAVDPTPTLLHLAGMQPQWQCVRSWHPHMFCKCRTASHYIGVQPTRLRQSSCVVVCDTMSMWLYDKHARLKSGRLHDFVRVHDAFRFMDGYCECV